MVTSEAKSTVRPIVELVWMERLPLGMNLLMNDESGLLKVVDFPRGSQARLVCERRSMDPDLFKGSTVIGVNGSEYEDQEDLFEALKDPARPKTVMFRLAESEEAERLRQFVEGPKMANGDDSRGTPKDRLFTKRDVDFVEPGELGIVFGTAIDDMGLTVSGFLEGEGGIVHAAERSNQVNIGDLLTHVNHEVVLGSNGTGRRQAALLLERHADTRPLTISFTDSYLVSSVIETPENLPGATTGGPSELVLSEKSEGDTRRVLVNGFKKVPGTAESSGILIGDHLVFVNGLPVGAGCRWLDDPAPPSLDDITKMLKNESFYPLGLTFARPMKSESRWASPLKQKSFSHNEAETVCVTAQNFEKIGCVFVMEPNGDVVVKDFVETAGVFQESLSVFADDDLRLALSIESIDGERIPSYATATMVRNALERSWKSKHRVELVLCDDEKRAWTHGFISAGSDDC